MSGNRRSTTGSPWSKPSVSRSTTSPATLRSTRTSSVSNVATQTWPLRRNINPPAQSRSVHSCPQTVSVQLRSIHLHALPRADGDHGFALVVHIQHQLLGLIPAVAEKLLKNPRHIRHQIDRVVPHDGDPQPVISRHLLDLRRLDGNDLRQRHAPHRATGFGQSLNPRPEPQLRRCRTGARAAPPGGPGTHSGTAKTVRRRHGVRQSSIYSRLQLNVPNCQCPHGQSHRCDGSRYAAPVGQWEFVGRADELARLAAAATDPNDRGLILSGAAGLGKSRLLREAVRALPPTQYAVHVAAANIASSGLPFGGLAQVLPPDPPAGLSPAGLLRWAVDTLHDGADGRPIVLAVDDAHLLDPPSAALVHLLVREGATLLATLRTAEPVPPPVTALWTEGLADHAELAPLTPAESRGLLAAMLGAPVEAGSAQRLTRLAGGNPLLMRELVMAATGGGEMTQAYGIWRWTGRITLAPSLADLVDARIGSLTPGVRDVLELVAFGEPVGLPLLLRATDPADAETAEERGLIRV